MSGAESTVPTAEKLHVFWRRSFAERDNFVLRLEINERCDSDDFEHRSHPIPGNA